MPGFAPLRALGLVLLLAQLAQLAVANPVAVAPFGKFGKYYGRSARYGRSAGESAGAGYRLARRTSCNTASDRQCWSDGFDINTDYELHTPTTGVTRSYTLTLTEADDWAGGDGGTKAKAMLINGGFPGPTIEADWGDQIQVTVVNNLVTNGTSIHWHGIRQLNSNNMDGTTGITECPLPPNGGTRTYTFLATQYGSSWYHSHFSSQYGNGVLGSIVIRGPASANYDIDLGPLAISDWYYGATDTILARINDPSNPFIDGFPGAAPPSDNLLFNGVNVAPSGSGAGSYLTLNLTQGKAHLLRLINPSVENSYTVSLVGHSMTIVSTDFVPVQPVTVQSIYLAIGQRYDVVVNATATPGAYWLNVTMPTGPCGQSNNPYPAAILTYANANTTGLPTDPGTAPPDPSCADPGSSFFSPVVSRSAADATSFAPTGNQTLTTTLVTSRDNVSRVFWPVNDTPMNVSWSQPTLQFVQDGTTGSMPADENVISVASAGTMTYWLLQNNSSIPHPIHLHGHDVLVLGASPAIADPLSPGYTLRAYDAASDAATLNGNNPTRRDTTMLPAWGWLAVAFETNNPGAWLFHCHVAWHVSQGLSVQFLEQLDAIPGAVDLSSINEQCDSWNAYYPSSDPFTQGDSGI